MPAKILIIEGQTDYREIMKIWVQTFGCEVIEAQSGEEGLEKALTHAPNLIIMELELPGMDGIETLRRLRGNPKTAQTSVVVHSIWSDDERVRALGIEAFLTKPTSPILLRELVEKILKGR